jgi:hypothetical protein
MDREQVIQAISAPCKDIFRVQDGEIRFDSGAGDGLPSRGGPVSLSFSQQTESGEETVTRSLEGVVDAASSGQPPPGPEYLHCGERTGVEKATTIVADLACPVGWISP